MFVASRWCGAAFLVVLLCGGSGAVAHELDDYLREIRAKSPAYRAALHRWQAADAEVDAASALPDPSVGLGVFIQEVETRVGPQKQRVSLSQKVPWRGKLALKGRRARALADRAQTALNAIGLRLDSEFKTLYAEYFYVGRAIAITQDHLQLLKDLEGVITERYETNAAQYNDLIRIQIEIDALSDRLITQQEVAHPVKAAMNALLGREVDQALPFPESLPNGDRPRDPKTSSTLLNRHNPTLRGLDFQIEADRTAVDLAKKNHYPDFKFGLDWINTGSAAMPGQPESGKDPIVLSVGVNLPIWRKKYRAIDRAAASRVEASIQQRQDARTHLEAQLKRALFQWDDARRKVELYRDQIIPKAEESLTVTTSGFQTGENSYLDLIEAEKALLEFLLSLHKAQSNQLKAAAAIEVAIGVERSAEAREVSDHGKLD